MQGSRNFQSSGLESSHMVAKRRGELFRRIRAAQLVRLVRSLHQESVYDLGEESKLGPEDSASQVAVSIMTVDHEAPRTNCDFVICDLREPEEFEACHIMGAVSFPAPNVTRDRMLPEMYRLRNQPGKLIILYAWDERPGVESAQKLCNRGFENVFLLSGGLEDFIKSHYDYLEGRSLPPRPQDLTATNKFRSNASTISTNSSVSRKF